MLDDSENDIAGIHKISEDVKEILKLKYQALIKISDWDGCMETYPMLKGFKQQS